jgi:hypothetical protein
VWWCWRLWAVQRVLALWRAAGCRLGHYKWLAVAASRNRQEIVVAGRPAICFAGPAAPRPAALLIQQ